MTARRMTTEERLKWLANDVNTTAEKVLYIAMSELADDDGALVITNVELAKYGSISVSAVKRTIKTMEEKKMITIGTRPVKGRKTPERLFGIGTVVVPWIEWNSKTKQYKGPDSKVRLANKVIEYYGKGYPMHPQEFLQTINDLSEKDVKMMKLHIEHLHKHKGLLRPKIEQYVKWKKWKTSSIFGGWEFK